MIKTFKCKDTEKLYNGKFVKKFEPFARSARTRLRVLDSAEHFKALSGLPGNRFEALAGNRKGQYSIRINRQWRICFKWKEGYALDVEIVDYH